MSLHCDESTLYLIIMVLPCCYHYVRPLDRHLAAFIAELTRRYQRTAILLISDHGAYAPTAATVSVAVAFLRRFCLRYVSEYTHISVPDVSLRNFSPQ